MADQKFNLMYFKNILIRKFSRNNIPNKLLLGIYANITACTDPMKPIFELNQTMKVMHACAKIGVNPSTHVEANEIL